MSNCRLRKVLTLASPSALPEAKLVQESPLSNYSYPHILHQMSLLELPNELLLEIAACVLIKDTSRVQSSHLSQTCWRLHDIIAPQNLEYHETRLHLNPLLQSWRLKTASDDSTPEQKNTRAFEREFSNLIFRFSGNSVDDDLRCIRHFLFRASTIDNIKVFLDGRCNAGQLAPLLSACVQRQGLHLSITEILSMTYSHHEVEGGPFIFEFRSNQSADLVPLLNSRTGPSSVTSMTKFIYETIRSIFRLPSTKPADLGALQNDQPISTQPKPAYTIIRRPPMFEVRLPSSKPQIPELSIDGEAMFSASLYPWTLHVLNSAPLTSLSISRVSFALFNWTEILASVTIPSLLYLLLAKVHIASPDLISFLHRHPTLETLHISEYTLIGTVDFPASSCPPFLPRLSSLLATAEYLLPFLQHQDRGHLPLLFRYSVSLIPNNGPGIDLYPPARHQLHPVYDTIAEGHHKDLTLLLPPLASSGLIEWLTPKSDVKCTKGLLRQLPGIRALLHLYRPGEEPSQVQEDRVRDWLVNDDVLTQAVVGDDVANIQDLPREVLLDRFVELAVPQLKWLDTRL